MSGKKKLSKSGKGEKSIGTPVVGFAYRTASRKSKGKKAKKG